MKTTTLMEGLDGNPSPARPIASDGKLCGEDRDVLQRCHLQTCRAKLRAFHPRPACPGLPRPGREVVIIEPVCTAVLRPAGQEVGDSGQSQSVRQAGVNFPVIIC